MIAYIDAQTSMVCAGGKIAEATAFEGGSLGKRGIPV